MLKVKESIQTLQIFNRKMHSLVLKILFNLLVLIPKGILQCIQTKSSKENKTFLRVRSEKSINLRKSKGLKQLIYRDS